ncbi:hypothetical protein JG688_00015166 [Phytophthora aleatoria]|uniref:Uncharacterized protein n=1 Tax=Phytophthora aleatoria TaxID=2496075 RepID=A0A8J5IW25_9STRA|nr:hypothetical protein JG688_00015166 [Phytophthora aleatoria]
MVMCTHTDPNIAIEEEFFMLEQVLNQTADETSDCLKLLKKHLSDYDSRNGNQFRNTAASFMRTDMRNAKDTAMDLKHVAHEINKNQKPSKTEISFARNMMNSTARAMDTLKATARNYDRENKQRMGAKGKVDAAVGGRRDSEMDENRGLHGSDGVGHERDEDRGFYKESGGGLFGKNRHGDKQHGGLFGSDKDEEHHTNFPANEDDNGGRVTGSSETVETLVRKILRDNFSLSTLNHQIKAAENSLSPSLMERAKEKMHDVKEKIKGDKSDPHEGHHHQQTAMP